jgi:hypothetical protein
MDHTYMFILKNLFTRSWLGSFAARGKITGNIVSPVLLEGN